MTNPPRREPLTLWTFLLLLLPSVASTACASFPGGGGPSLEEEVRAIISTPPLDQVNWGILVVDPARDQVLFSRNAHRKFVPASNMKVLATATALSLLGPEFRFETKVWGLGELEASGRWNGDLVLIPTGDPTFSDEFYPSAEAPLDSLASQIRRAGLQSVSGTLVLDVSAWDSTTVPESWMVGNLASRSGATGAALAIGNGEVVMEVRAGPEVGFPAEIRWWPETPENFFSASFLTAPPDSSLRREVDYLPESRRLRVEGRIPLGSVDTLSVSQRAPEAVATAAILRALERQGIRVGGGVRVARHPGQPMGPGDFRTGDDPETCPESMQLASLSSPPMAEIVKAILEPSQNWMTEQLVHVLGLELGEEGSWREGFRVEEDFLTGEVGVDSLDLHFRDGSGLSAYNLITPRAMVRTLEYMKTGPHGAVFMHAMAEPGEEGSTLRNRLEGLEGRVYAKTGTISHVNSLSGYVVTREGRELVFSILTNGSGLPSGTVRGGIDAVLQAVARR